VVTIGVGSRTTEGTVGSGTKEGTGEKRWARSDFQKLVIGKTQEEIRKILGDPDEVIISARQTNDGEGWLYRRKTYIPPAKNTDDYALILFNRFFSPPPPPRPLKPGETRRPRSREIVGPDGIVVRDPPPPPHPDEGKILPAFAVSYPDGTTWGS
jgi:hypothetical protein